jgi:hypothetical protein
MHNVSSSLAIEITNNIKVIKSRSDTKGLFEQSETKTSELKIMSFATTAITLAIAPMNARWMHVLCVVDSISDITLTRVLSSKRVTVAEVRGIQYEEVPPFPLRRLKGFDDPQMVKKGDRGPRDRSRIDPHQDRTGELSDMSNGNMGMEMTRQMSLFARRMMRSKRKNLKVDRRKRSVLGVMKLSPNIRTNGVLGPCGGKTWIRF